jgi:pSer/pThr/pTyr-binding forkhead associated (FHA) protein
MEREPSATARRATTTQRTEPRKVDSVYAEVRYTDDSGPQVYQVTQNRVRVGRGGDDQPMDLALYTNDEVSREHMIIRRDPATGGFFVSDLSTNGTAVNGKKLRKGVEEPLPERADILVGDILTLQFEVRK